VQPNPKVRRVVALYEIWCLESGGPECWALAAIEDGQEERNRKNLKMFCPTLTF
jgi:hypothetical protein